MDVAKFSGRFWCLPCYPFALAHGLHRQNGHAALVTQASRARQALACFSRCSRLTVSCAHRCAHDSCHDANSSSVRRPRHHQPQGCFGLLVPSPCTHGEQVYLGNETPSGVGRASTLDTRPEQDFLSHAGYPKDNSDAFAPEATDKVEYRYRNCAAVLKKKLGRVEHHGTLPGVTERSPSR